LRLKSGLALENPEVAKNKAVHEKPHPEKELKMAESASRLKLQSVWLARSEFKYSRGPLDALENPEDAKKKKNSGA